MHQPLLFSRYILTAGTIVVSLALLISAIAPFDRVTWWLEVIPVMVVFPLLWVTRKSFTWTGLLYALMSLHALVLIFGGAYSYARVPLGFWMEDLFGLSRNPYDKIGHFMQGFVPVLVARELMLRRNWVNGYTIAGVLSVCVAMTVSALYEIVEWFAAVLLGQGAEEFLGTQGYEWDTQSDMGFALLGSVLAVVLLSRLHNRLIRELEIW